LVSNSGCPDRLDVCHTRLDARDRSISKGKAYNPDEFGAKVTLSTTLSEGLVVDIHGDGG